MVKLTGTARLHTINAYQISPALQELSKSHSTANQFWRQQCVKQTSKNMTSTNSVHNVKFLPPVELEPSIGHQACRNDGNNSYIGMLHASSPRFE